jgi:hypothetical protein
LRNLSPFLWSSERTSTSIPVSLLLIRDIQNLRCSAVRLSGILSVQ